VSAAYAVPETKAGTIGLKHHGRGLELSRQPVSPIRTSDRLRAKAFAATEFVYLVRRMMRKQTSVPLLGEGCYGIPLKLSSAFYGLFTVRRLRLSWRAVLLGDEVIGTSRLATRPVHCHGCADDCRVEVRFGLAVAAISGVIR